MKKLTALLVLAAAWAAGPSASQTVSGCGAAAISKAEGASVAKLAANADCFAKAKAAASAAEQARRERVVALTPAPVPVPTPAPAPTAQPLVVTPIASNFAREPFIITGRAVPVSAAPDVVGAFRFICTAGQMSYDDPILFPGRQGGSPHLHQFFGNTTADYRSTYMTLRADGDSTCSNRINRSGYWVPALFNAAGMVIRPDYISVYYKRRPVTDPECLREAPNGCVPLPAGLRVVSGYNTSLMGQPQPENRKFHFDCLKPVTTAEHRATLGEALIDCGGSGQIMAVVEFSPCWNGQLDSADHRAHLAAPSYGGWGYLKCPTTHPYVIPSIQQGVVYTIATTDGDIYFASDRMNGMNMPGGSTYHADYMEAWDPPARETWSRNCLDKLLNCSDGELGDGTMLRRQPLTYLASPRLVVAPAR